MDENIFLSNPTGFSQRQPAISFCYATINLHLNNLSPFSLSHIAYHDFKRVFVPAGPGWLLHGCVTSLDYPEVKIIISLFLFLFFLLS